MGCYRNKFPGSYIYSSARSVPVYWGHFSIVEAELLCLTDLMVNGRNWSYAVNMAGSEVMMFTNRELVANISANMGRIYTESFPLPEGNQFRVKYQHKYDNPGRGQRLGDHDPPPFNLTIYKGAKSWRLPRKFVTFLLDHPVAKKYLGEPHFVHPLIRVILMRLQSGPSSHILLMNM